MIETARTRFGRVQGPACALGAVLLLGLPAQVRAEFQVQEAGVEKGEVEVEYRGAYHTGLPDGDDAIRQSHESEMEIGITDWWLLQIGGEFTELRDSDLEGESVEIEAIFELVERKGDGFGIAFQIGYEAALRDEEADEFAFGPIVEFKSGCFLTILNTFFSNQVGRFDETDGLGLEYAARLTADIGKRYAVGVEAFGEIEDLSNAGSFDEQEHTVGPVLLISFGDDEDEAGEAAGGDDNEAGGMKQPEPPKLSLALGVQFGLTEEASDAAFRFGASFEF